MPRRLRLQYPGAIYHLMARGNGRQDIVSDDVDRERLQEQLGKALFAARGVFTPSPSCPTTYTSCSRHLNPT
jgi:hypothetical protein